MPLLYKLGIVLLAFIALLTVVISVAFRERRIGRGIAGDDIQAQQATDARVLAVIFSAIFGGLLLTLLVDWLVFF
jgi:hypothetical protein